eukprot:CAMPEP_0183740186 /NCGR_PEP_ID=MMETSP0737-20130205/58939_1 /TAXON_ID=385413 /ORGANISM="Thalassiosira miniscula, Strain CCMP1093" /LENGTH=101 /DNA_ID=CAMNT_0025975183 /DNA_START=24 /DNA_END=325 /DNA_ORIENTATION=-
MVIFGNESGAFNQTVMVMENDENIRTIPAATNNNIKLESGSVPAPESKPKKFWSRPTSICTRESPNYPNVFNDDISDRKQQVLREAEEILSYIATSLHKIG